MSELRRKSVDEKFCGECGTIIKVKAEICPQCGVRQIPIQKPSDVSKLMKFLAPVNGSTWAIAAGYLGLFTLFNYYLAPFAVFTGVMALIDIKKHPEKIGKGRAFFGIVVGVFCIFNLIEYYYLFIY